LPLDVYKGQRLAGVDNDRIVPRPARRPQLAPVDALDRETGTSRGTGRRRAPSPGGPRNHLTEIGGADPLRREGPEITSARSGVPAVARRRHRGEGGDECDLICSQNVLLMSAMPTDTETVSLPRRTSSPI
jgi:hypothetical protein